MEKKSGQTCHDKLEIYDGITTVQKPPLIGTYCGTDTPVVPESTHNSVELDFISDGRVQGTGFTVKWTSKKGLCGGRVSTPTGIIQSPGYPRLDSKIILTNDSIVMRLEILLSYGLYRRSEVFCFALTLD